MGSSRSGQMGRRAAGRGVWRRAQRGTVCLELPRPAATGASGAGQGAGRRPHMLVSEGLQNRAHGGLPAQDCQRPGWRAGHVLLPPPLWPGWRPPVCCVHTTGKDPGNLTSRWWSTQRASRAVHPPKDWSKTAPGAWLPSTERSRWRAACQNHLQERMLRRGESPKWPDHRGAPRTVAGGPPQRSSSFFKGTWPFTLRRLLSPQDSQTAKCMLPPGQATSGEASSVSVEIRDTHRCFPGVHGAEHPFLLILPPAESST